MYRQILLLLYNVTCKQFCGGLMNLKLENNNLNCAFNRFILSNVKASLQYRGNHYNTLEIESQDWLLNQQGNIATSQTPNGTFTLKTKKCDGGISLSLSFKASGKLQTIKGHRLIIKGFLPVKPQLVNYNAPQVEDWVRNFEMSSISRSTGLIKNQRVEAGQYCAFKTNRNLYGMIGFVTFNNSFGEVALNENGEFEIYCNLDRNDICANDLIKTDECWIYLKTNEKDILSAYGKRIAKENKVTKRVDIPTGWCSWYYYGPNISQEIILENLAKVKEQNLPIKYIQIDDGWQKCYGDWTENDKFSNGMKALADKIKEQGYLPGIWFTPCLFSKDAKIVKEHPEYFVHDDNGELNPKLLIDYSNKGARDWLYDIARRLSVEWGFRYIKIDLITFRLAPNGYKNRKFNALKNFKQAVKTMRSAVTPDTVFLTCTSPLGASAGIAECVRISDDIFERWDSLKLVAKQCIRRYFINEYINIDPDCLMVRTIDKHNDDAFRYCTRDDREILTFINFMSAMGGAIMLSDKLTLLDDVDFDRIKTLFPINTTPAKPVDIFESDIPSILHYGKRNGLDMYALFNWTNVKDTIKLDLKGEKFVRTFYSKQTSKTDKYQITLEPHASEIIYVADNEEAFNCLGTSIMPN